MSESTDWLPLFPLSQPLFPGLRLDLQIFEQRYLKLVRSSMREDLPFGICAISEGSEAGVAASLYSIGVEVKIMDFGQLENGLLSITVQGDRRFSIVETEIDPDGLIRAQVQYMEQDEDEAIPDWCSGLAELYSELRNHPEVYRRLPEIEEINCVGLSNGLAQILPMSTEERIHCLSMKDAMDRLDFLIDHIQTLSNPV
ncbi:MAG: LON peptidase substrate-binding domain-containing protein [Porticoccaceae bacterium]